MKKLSISLIAVFGMILAISAQETQFGLKAGLNISTISGDTSGLDSRTALHFGVASEFPISDAFSFQPELLYSAQGTKADGEELKIDYLNIPLIAKYYVAEGLSIEAGPQIGFLLSAKTEFDGEDDEDVKDAFKSIDFGLNFGLGYKLENGLNFGARYNVGLSNMSDEDEDFLDDFKIQNSVFQISIGYFF